MNAPRIRSFIMVMLVLVLCAQTSAQHDRFFLKSPRAIGMGGAGVAVLSQEHVFFYNPAQLNRLKRARLTIMDARLTFNKNLWEQVDFYQKHSDEISNLDNFSDDETTQFFEEAADIVRKRVLLDFSGPLPVNLVMRNFGVGVFTGADVDYRMHTGASSIPILDATIEANFMLTASAAYGFKNLIPGTLSFGGTVKYLNRWLTSKIQSVTEIDDELLVYSGEAVGVDLGAFYSIRRFAFGMTLFDVNSPTVDYVVNSTGDDTTRYRVAPDGTIEPALRMGAAYYLHRSPIPMVQNIIFALDVEQPFDSEITFFKKLYFGVEGTMLRFLKLRTGFAQGYPTLGLGIDLSVIKLDYAFFGNELGRYAGQLPNYNHSIRFQLGF